GRHYLFRHNGSNFDLIGPSLVSGARLVTTNTGAVAGDNLFVDSSGGNVTITLPASPTIRDRPIDVTQVAGAASSVTIARNNKRIMGLTQDMTLDVANASIRLQFVNDTVGWRLRIIG